MTGEGSYDNTLSGELPPPDSDKVELSEPRHAFVALAVAGAIRGVVLEIGCGAGENSLFLAQRGHEVYGIDMVRSVVGHANAMAQTRELSAVFQVASALELENLGRRFDTIIDSGMFQIFGAADRRRYVDALVRVINPGGRFHMLCLADQDTLSAEPCKIRLQEIRDCFSDGWKIVKLEPSLYEDPNHDCTQAWLATIEKNRDEEI